MPHKTVKLRGVDIVLMHEGMNGVVCSL